MSKKDKKKRLVWFVFIFVCLFSKSPTQVKEVDF